MQTVIDMHTHAFPDEIAARAMPKLAAEADLTPALDGTLGALLRSMDEASVDQSVLLSIATKPSQFDAIMDWSRTIRSERIIPFPSVHPSDPLALERLDRIATEFRGIKLHPYYQDFLIDEARMFPIYERCIERNLILLCHTGYDIAFPRDPRATPERIVRVADRYPELRLITSHIGAWDDWAAVRDLMLGRPIYMDVSYSFEFPDPDNIIGDILARHPAEYILFGSDSPWGDQRQTIERIRERVADPATRAAILGGNAARLLG